MSKNRCSENKNRYNEFSLNTGDNYAHEVEPLKRVAIIQ